jgi:hypothetical protein
MIKDIAPYLNHYLGCEALLDGRVKVTIVGFEQYSHGTYRPVIRLPDYKFRLLNDLSLLQLLLRPLSDMTEAEMQECGNLDYDFSGDPDLNKWTPADFDLLLTSSQFLWLLSRGFDLFGLIEAGLAIDKTTKEVEK